jgi:large subunit ribosomal protein L15
MMTLDTLQNTSRPKKTVKRVGRGLGSGLGKTCGRGEKGAGSRSGYKRRYGYEGGQFRMFMKMPIRGFSNEFFKTRYETVNLGQIEAMYSDGENVDAQSLCDKGFISNKAARVKVLGNGELTKKVKISAHAYTQSAESKLQHTNTPFENLQQKKRDAK